MHKCNICGTNDQKSFYHAYNYGEACERCAEEYGCSCGCFPNRSQRLLLELVQIDYPDAELVKDEHTERWQIEV